MRYKVYLDNVLVDEPLGMDNYTISLKREYTLNTLLKTIDMELGFIGDGYAYLYNLFNTTGFCGQVDCRIMQSCDEGQSYTQSYVGIIFLSDIVFNELDCIARTKVQDNSFWAKINNNKKIGAYLHVGTSKNGATITAPTPYPIEFFNPADSVAYPITPGDRHCAAYRIYDVFRFLIDFMTDGTVNFTSTDFGAAGDYEGTFITIGKVLQDVQAADLTQADFEAEWPVLNFETVLSEIKKRIPIGITVDYVGGSPTLRIESLDYFYNDTVSFTASNVDKIETKTAKDKLYAKVRFGSESTFTAGSFPVVTWLGFNEEEYHIKTTCNIDSELDLTASWIVDTNIIEDCIVYTNTDFTNDIFLISCVYDVGDAQWEATQINWVDSAPKSYYNYTFTNSQVGNRQNGIISNDIAVYVNPTQDLFEANRSTDGSLSLGDAYTSVAVDYDNEVTDAGNDYDNATYKYTAPASGIYTFSVQLLLWVRAIQTGYPLGFRIPEITLDLYRYDSGNVLIETITIDQSGYVLGYAVAGQNGINDLVRTVILQGSVSLYLQSTDYVNIKFSVGNANNGESTDLYVKKLAGGYFKNVIDGTTQGYDPNEFTVLLHEFKYPLSKADFDTIDQNNIQAISFYQYGQTSRKGWIESLKYEAEKGEATFLLTTNRAANGT
jgi:hypothetical protein